MLMPIPVLLCSEARWFRNAHGPQEEIDEQTPDDDTQRTSKDGTPANAADPPQESAPACAAHAPEDGAPKAAAKAPFSALAFTFAMTFLAMNPFPFTVLHPAN